MRLRYGIAGILVTSTLAWSGSTERPVVRVIVANSTAVEWTILSKAKMTASDILADAGVQLKWSKGAGQGDCRERLIGITFSEFTPDALVPGAMGYALPYAASGIRVIVFLDRLRPAFVGSPNWRGAILGHVMAHELVHVLQGIARHTDRGLMKGRWTEDDFQQMGVKSLGLTPHDLALIRKGLAQCSTLAERVVP